MKTNYFLERNKQNTKHIANFLNDMPDFCFEFFIGMENYTSTLTRMNYAMDLRIFFDYLSKYKFDKNAKAITLSDLDKLTSTDIEGYLSYLTYYTFDNKNFHNGERGKARKLASVRSFLKFFYNKDKITSNVASKIQTPKLHQKDIIRLEIDEVAKILNEAENSNFESKTQASYNKHTAKRDVAILSVFLGTGIRVSELVGLNIEDIDFASNAFKITRKGGNQVVLYFSDEVKDALLEYKKQRDLLEINDNAFFLSLQKKTNFN